MKKILITITGILLSGFILASTIPNAPSMISSNPVISLNASNLILYSGSTYTLKANATTNTSGLIWNSSNPAAVTVDSNGNLTPIGPGSATITATLPNNENISGSCVVTVPTVGVWLTVSASQVLNSEANIEQAVQLCKASHINTIAVAVWDQSMTNYPSQIMQNTTGVPINPQFSGTDPLKEIVATAHAQGIKVIAWFEYGFATSYNDPTGGPILQKNPSWKAIDNNGQIVTSNNFQWMNGFSPDVQNFMASLMKEVVDNYDVDGVQCDDRMPAMPENSGYDPYTIKLYEDSHNGQQPPSDYTNSDWVNWRASLLNQYLQHLFADIKTDPNRINKSLTVTMAPSVYPWSLQNYLQDWPAWVRGNYVDGVYPQVYRYDLPSYESTLQPIVQSQIPQSFMNSFAPGMVIQVGTTPKNLSTFQSMIDYNKSLGIYGAMFFFYEGLTNSTLQSTIANAYSGSAVISTSGSAQ